MARLSTGDLAALLHVVDDLSGKVTTYSDIDLGRGVPIEASDQPALLECAARDRFARFMHEHSLIRPHLVRAVAITRLVAQLVDALVSPFTRSEDSAVDGLVAIDRAGRTRLMTTRARRLLEAYVGRVSGRNRLPEVVRAWLRTHGRGHRSGDGPRPLDPLVIAGERGTLSIWPRPTPEGVVLLMEEQSKADVKAHVSRARLTPREAEVLRWVAEGKTSAEIADIIGARPRTVDKHLEHIFSKLGVENRTAAAVMLARRPAATR